MKEAKTDIPNTLLSWLGTGTSIKSVKITKGESEAVNRRRTDSIMAKKKDDRTNNILQNITPKTTDHITGVNSSEGWHRPVTHIVLLLNDANII